MSDYKISFIPSNPDFFPDGNQMKQLMGFRISDCLVTFETREDVAFADAGSNFESVTCPYCSANSIDWWGDAMNNAYSESDGFLDLSIITPCCGEKSSLNDLNYYFPQGFYRTRIIVEPFIGANVDVESIRDRLEKIIGVNLRVVHQHI